MSNGDEKENACKLHLFERNNYFYGKLMTVRDFTLEQGYFNEKRWLVNRLVHGSGIVCGLSLSGNNITVDTTGQEMEIFFTTGGVALDPAGHEIIVPDRTKKTVFDGNGNSIKSSSEEEKYFLFLKYRPCTTEMVNAASSQSSCDESCCPNRIREDFDVIALTENAAVPYFAKYPPVKCKTVTGLSASSAVPEKPGDTATAEIASLRRTSDALERAAGTTATSELVKKTSLLAEWVPVPCPDCGMPMVFLAIVKSPEWNMDVADTQKYRSVLISNWDLTGKVYCHFTDPDAHGLRFDVDDNTPLARFDAKGTIFLKKEGAIELKPATNTITIGEKHSADTKNPHNTQHAQLQDVQGWDAGENDPAARNKHISYDDAMRWDEGTGGACQTGTVIFKDVNPGNDTRTSGTIELEKPGCAIVLGVLVERTDDASRSPGSEEWIYEGDTLRKAGIYLSSRVSGNQLQVHLEWDTERFAASLDNDNETISKVAGKSTPYTLTMKRAASVVVTPDYNLTVRYWAVPPSAPEIPQVEVPAPEELDKPELEKHLRLVGEASLESLKTRFPGVEEKILDKAVVELVNEDKISGVSLAGTTRKTIKTSDMEKTIAKADDRSKVVLTRKPG